MNTWDLDFGIVKHWDDFNFKHETVQMKIKYDANSDMPVKIDYIDDGKIVGTALSIDLNVKEVQSPYGNIEICGEIYYFDKEQINQILSAREYWKKNSEYEKSKCRIVDDNGVCPLGLVLHYNTNEHQYLLCDLEIQYNKLNQDNQKMIIKTKEYNSDKLTVIYSGTSFCDRFDCEFEGIENEYTRYRMCNHLFLFNSYQEQRLKEYISCLEDYQ